MTTQKVTRSNSLQRHFVFSLSVVLLASALNGCAHKPVESKNPLISESSNGELTEVSSNARIVLIPQWHLSPQDNTRENARTHFPQSANQVAIYRQLSEWVQSGQVQTILVEGCEGEIGPDSKLIFNGWTVQALGDLSEKDLDTTLTQVGLKLKARLGDRVRVLCGDNQKQIEKQLLILSDLRGLLGFKMRISQLKAQPAKQKDYVATVRELLKLRPESDDQQVIEALDIELQGKLDAYEGLIRDRNASFMASIEKEKAPRLAVVIGSLHVPDLQKRIREKGESVVTFRPVGLKGSEADLIQQVRDLLKANK